MTTLAERLDRALRAVCPILGVSIGRSDDRVTWRIDFADQATAQQRADAQAELLAFDTADPPQDGVSGLLEREQDRAQQQLSDAIDRIPVDQREPWLQLLVILKGK